MQEGFITALGTPLTPEGELEASSFIKQISDQIDCGASALLVMGTMGNEAYLVDSVYVDVARTAATEAGGRVPTLVGVMDCSVGRVSDRIRALDGLEIDGVVATAPFYLKCTQAELYSFFMQVADKSPFPLYLYDLPPVAQVAIDVPTVKRLMNHPNIRGIKSGVLPTCRILQFDPDRTEDFLVMYSGLDTFDVAWSYGIRKNLDGMFSCTPKLAYDMYSALDAGNDAAARATLDNIIGLRNAFIEVGVLKGFTAAMNILGYEGSFSPDYVPAPTDSERESIGEAMARYGVKAD